MRWLMLMALSLLGACDEVPDQPTPPTPPAPPKVVAPAADPAETVSAEPRLGARDGRDSIEIEPESDELTSLGQSPAKPVTLAPKAKPASVAAAKTKPEEAELPEPDLDLSLPEDWADSLAPADEPTSMSLLPPLFEPSRGARSLQLSGELLPGAAEDEAIIDGAQINFELKR